MKKTNALRLLEQAKIAYKIFEYPYGDEELRTTKLIDEANLERDQVFKTLIGKGDKTGYFVAVVPIDMHLNYKAIAKASGNKKTALIPLKSLTPLTGYVRGGCSPLGMKKAFPTYFDEHIILYDEILVNAGQRGLLMRVAPADLVRITDGEVVEIAQEKE